MVAYKGGTYLNIWYTQYARILLWFVHIVKIMISSPDYCSRVIFISNLTCMPTIFNKGHIASLLSIHYFCPFLLYVISHTKNGLRGISFELVY